MRATPDLSSLPHSGHNLMHILTYAVYAFDLEVEKL